MKTDTDYIEGVISEANYVGPAWEIIFKEVEDAEFEMGFTFQPDEDDNVYITEPKVGDSIRVYGFGAGDPVRGLIINGETVFYFTQDEWKLLKIKAKLNNQINAIDAKLEELRQ